MAKASNGKGKMPTQSDPKAPPVNLDANLSPRQKAKDARGEKHQITDMSIKEIMFQKGMTFDQAKQYLEKLHS